MAVNANSIDFLKQLGIWNMLKSKPQPIDKIVIKDNINKNPLFFENDQESMGNVILIKKCIDSKTKTRKFKNFKN